MPDSQPVCSASRHLQRIDASASVWHFYTLVVWPDLFGGVTLVREWGRIGQDGSVRRRHFTDEAAAEQELNRISRRTIRSGYRPVASPVDAQPSSLANRYASPRPFAPRIRGPARNARQTPPTSASSERSRPNARLAVRPSQASPLHHPPSEACRD